MNQATLPGIGAGLGEQKRAELAGLLRACFARVEPWLQARRYVSAVVSGLAKRNGWTITEQAGDRAPDNSARKSFGPQDQTKVAWPHLTLRLW